MLSILWVAVDPAPDTSEAQQVVCCAPWKAHLQKEETGAGEAACPRPPGGWSAGPRKCSAGLSVGAGGAPPRQPAIRGAGPRPSISRPSGAEWARWVAQSQLRGWGEACDQWRGAGTPAAQGPPPIGCLRYTSYWGRAFGPAPLGSGVGRTPGVGDRNAEPDPQVSRAVRAGGGAPR